VPKYFETASSVLHHFPGSRVFSPRDKDRFYKNQQIVTIDEMAMVPPPLRSHNPTFITCWALAWRLVDGFDAHPTVSHIPVAGYAPWI
jgi:hypothetical protein